MIQTKTKVLFCYEKKCGGETRITENFINFFKTNNIFYSKFFSMQPLVKTDFVNYFKWQIQSVYRWIKIIWLNRGVNVVYTTTYTAGVAAILVKPFANFKVCFHYHGNRIPIDKINIDLFHNISHRIKYISTHLLHALFVYKCDLIIVSSTFSINKLVKNFNKLALSKFKVVPNGVDLAKFRLKNKINQYRKHMNIQHDSKILLSVGRIDPAKNTLRLIEVFNIVSVKIPKLYLVIAYPKVLTNEGIEYKNKLLYKIKSLGLTTHVIWEENSSDLTELYQAGDLAISFSDEENFPMTLLESFASGLLYASTTSGETNTILTNIDKILVINNGTIAQQANQIIDLLKISNTKRVILKKKLIQVVRQFDIKNSANHLIREITSC